MELGYHVTNNFASQSDRAQSKTVVQAVVKQSTASSKDRATDNRSTRALSACKQHRQQTEKLRFGTRAALPPQGWAQAAHAGPTDAEKKQRRVVLSTIRSHGTVQGYDPASNAGSETHKKQRDNTSY